MVTIKVRKSGSLLVEGEDVRLVDWDGNEYVIGRTPFALCRCGASQRRPVCDGRHKACGFQSEEAAPGPDAPAVDPLTAP